MSWKNLLSARTQRTSLMLNIGHVYMHVKTADGWFDMLKSIIEFFEAIGRARAAHHLASSGHYDLARKILMSDSDNREDKFEVHP
jgi:hypothetical protein